MSQVPCSMAVRYLVERGGGVPGDRVSGGTLPCDLSHGAFIETTMEH